VSFSAAGGSISFFSFLISYFQFMLHLFRFIRKDLIQVNNVKKYLLYAIGEILLIVIGILIAVQIGNWNDRRLARIEERIILERIRQEVEESVSDIPRRFEGLVRKNEALDRVAHVFIEQAIEDHLSFLEDVWQARVWGWGMPTVNRVTFEEYVSSGKLGLIQNADLRSQIMYFFDRAEALENQATHRMGEYHHIVADLIPEGKRRGMLTGLEESKYAAIAESVLKSDLSSHIVRERSRSLYLEYIWNEISEIGEQLLVEIESELEGR
jgi:hypothetical protein